MDQISLECPYCQKEIEIPTDEILKYLPPKKQSRINIISVVLGILVAICLTIVMILIISFGKEKQKVSVLSNENQSLKKKIEEEQTLIVERMKEANLIAAEAKEKAQATLTEAQTRAQEIEGQAKTLVLQAQKRLHEAYPNLRKYSRGINVVNEKYIESFEFSRQRLLVRMRNDTYNFLKPRFTIFFLTDAGFVTGEGKVYWLLNSIDAGGIRNEDITVTMRFGEPEYYLIQFEE